MSTLDRKSDHDTRRAARAEAAAWVVRLHGPYRSPELEEGFKQWLAAEPERARQFERVTDIWDASARVAIDGLPRVRTRWRGSPARAWALAASVAAAAVAVFYFSGLFRSGVEYRTGIGTLRVVQLRDGSRISLDADTAVRVAYGETERRVRLESGQAYFQVRHNPGWPFVVVAGRHQITDIGTAFMVRYGSGRTAVTLLEGRVAVSSRSHESGGSARVSPAAAPGLAAGGQPQAIILTAGQRLTFAAAGPPQLDRPRLDDLTAWLHREIMLNDTPLPRAIAQLNRYDPVRLVIADPQVARLRVSGIYHTGNNREFALLLAKLYGIQFAEHGDRITLSSGENPSR
ncbi:MAG: FecR family protein [Acetobacteraceae bacterium]